MERVIISVPTEEISQESHGLLTHFGFELELGHGGDLRRITVAVEGTWEDRGLPQLREVLHGRSFAVHYEGGTVEHNFPCGCRMLYRKIFGLLPLTLPDDDDGVYIDPFSGEMYMEEFGTEELCSVHEREEQERSDQFYLNTPRD